MYKLLSLIWPNNTYKMEENKLKINDKNVDEVLESKGHDIAGGETFHYKEKPFTGIIESFYENGNMRDTDGSISGFGREYYENSQIKS